MRRRRAWCLAGLLAGCVLTSLYFARHAVLPAMARWLDVGVEPQHGAYDGVMVLGGDDNVRPFAAAALYKTGFARRVLLADVVSSPGTDHELAPPRHDISRRILLLRGVPPRDLQVIGQSCESTFDEAQALADVLDASPELQVLVVTSDFHTRRARWVFDRVLGERAAQVTFVSVPTETAPPDRWWHNQAGFLFVTSEYVKLWSYGFRYGNLGYWTAGAVAGSLGAYLLVRRGRRRRNRAIEGGAAHS